MDLPSPLSLPVDRTRPKGRRGRYRSREFLLGSVSSRLGQRKRQSSSLQLPSKPSHRLQKNSSESISRSWTNRAIHASIAHETVQEDLRDEPRSSTGEGNQTHNEPAGDWDPSRTCRHCKGQVVSATIDGNGNRVHEHGNRSCASIHARCNTSPRNDETQRAVWENRGGWWLRRVHWSSLFRCHDCPICRSRSVTRVLWEKCIWSDQGVLA